jgi:hypothetical protein
MYVEPKTDQITATSQTEEAATTVEHRDSAPLASSEESSQIARDQLYAADPFLRAIAEQFPGLPRSIIRELNVALVTPTLCAFMRNEESSKLMLEALHFMQDLRSGRIKDYEERLMDSDLVARERLRRYISRRRASIARSEDFKRQLLSTLRSESTAPAPEALPGVRIVDVRDEENPAPDAATPEITSNHVELSLLPHALQVAVEHGAFHDVFEKHLQKILDSLPGPLETRILAAQRLLPLLESKISRVNKLHTHNASPRTKARLDRLRQTRERLEVYIELLKHPEDSSGLRRDTSLVKRESISSIVLHSIDDLRRSIDVSYLQQLTEKTTADQRHVLWEKALRRLDMCVKRSKRIGPHSELRKDMENLEAIRK